MASGTEVWGRRLGSKSATRNQDSVGGPAQDFRSDSWFPVSPCFLFCRLCDPRRLLKAFLSLKWEIFSVNSCFEPGGLILSLCFC